MKKSLETLWHSIVLVTIALAVFWFTLNLIQRYGPSQAKGAVHTVAGAVSGSAYGL